jgi:N4-(beta-N-acetylglucosaminyl)-L-asparaginase
MTSKSPASASQPSRRDVLAAAAAGALGASCASATPALAAGSRRASLPVMVGSANALAGMQLAWQDLLDGGDPLDAAIATVKVAEADPEDTSVGLGGLPNEEGVVQLDAACMYGPTHNSGGVAAIENILHPSEVARLVMERTDHCLLVGPGAYAFARMHGHPHTELLTDRAREEWLRWREGMSDRDDRLPPSEGASRHHGTVHCSALSTRGEVACTTTTSGLSFKIPGRVGDSPIVGAGLYCDQEAGSAGSTGRGEAAILANASFAIVELMRQGAAPEEAGLEVLRRIARQVTRQAEWQPALADADGRPAFGIRFYVLAADGRWAGVTMAGEGTFAVADPEGGPRLEPLVACF